MSSGRRTPREYGCDSFLRPQGKLVDHIINGWWKQTLKFDRRALDFAAAALPVGPNTYVVVLPVQLAAFETSTDTLDDTDSLSMHMSGVPPDAS